MWRTDTSVLSSGDHFLIYWSMSRVPTVFMNDLYSDVHVCSCVWLSQILSGQSVVSYAVQFRGITPQPSHICAIHMLISPPNLTPPPPHPPPPNSFLLENTKWSNVHTIAVAVKKVFFSIIWFLVFVYFLFWYTMFTYTCITYSFEAEKKMIFRMCTS